MTRIAVGLEFDGLPYCGWQRQIGADSVQAQVEGALSQLFDHPIAVTTAGRTDTGVHARALVAHFDSDVPRSERAIVLGGNSNLPTSISIRWARAVPDHFHARYSATARIYRYCILNRSTRSALTASRVAFEFHPLELLPMQTAAAHFVGTHDFTAFRAAQCQARSPVRNLMALSVQQKGDFFLVEVAANAFLHHMVRNIVGLLLFVGRGKVTPDFARELLQGRDRRLAPPTAPAAGLYLWRVHYPAVFGLPDDSDIMGTAAGCPADLMD
jgi:tRNA pseudouridine38-40 synthase